MVVMIPDPKNPGQYKGMPDNPDPKRTPLGRFPGTIDISNYGKLSPRDIRDLHIPDRQNPIKTYRNFEVPPGQSPTHQLPTPAHNPVPTGWTTKDNTGMGLVNRPQFSGTSDTETNKLYKLDDVITGTRRGKYRKNAKGRKSAQKKEHVMGKFYGL